MRMKNICVIENCNKNVHGLGKCSYHYNKEYNVAQRKLPKYRCYHSWYSMVKRCSSRSGYLYKYYSSRGIFVCDRWKNSFHNFVEDMGYPDDGMTIERINNDDGYYKENCRWASMQEQSLNKRTSHFIYRNGIKLNVSLWAKRLGVDKKTVVDWDNKNYNSRFI